MGPLAIDTPDDPILDDFLPDFSGGMVSYVPPARLQLNQAASLVNIDIDRQTAATRRGTRRLGNAPIVNGARVQGLLFYDTPAFEFLVAAVGGELFSYSGGTAGWSKFSTYAAADGDAQVEIAQLIDTIFIADGQSHLYSFDNTTLTDMGTGGANEPPVGSYIIAHSNRLWLAGVPALPDGLYCSEVLTPGTWDPAQLAIRIGGGEGDAITGISGWDDFQIVVGKNNSIWVVRADPVATATSLANATVTRISGQIGVVGHRTMVQVGNDVWFLAQDGVRSVQRTIATEQREVSDTISAPIFDVIERINWQYAHLSAACFWKNRFMICVPLDDATVPDTVLVYNTRLKAWSGVWVGWRVAAWAVSRFDGQARLNFGHNATGAGGGGGSGGDGFSAGGFSSGPETAANGQSDGEVRQWLDYIRAANEDLATFYDVASPVGTEIATRAFIFNDGIAPKSGLACEFEFDGATAVQTPAVVFDGQEVTLSDAFSAGVAALTLPFTLPQTFPVQKTRRITRDLLQFEPFREMQLVLRTESGKQSLRSVLASAMPNTREIDDN